MKKSISALLLTFSLVLGLLPTPAFAEDPPPHSHPECGQTCTHDSQHSSQTWTAWNQDYYLPSSPGYYYLTADVKLGDKWNINFNVNEKIYLCLNGHTITDDEEHYDFPLVEMTSACEFYLCDCNTTTQNTITSASDSQPISFTGGGIGGELQGVCLSSSGTFTMYGGSIVGNKQGGVQLNNSDAKFIMFGGAITDNVSTLNGCAGVSLRDGSTFKMYGGEITRNSAPTVGGVDADTTSNPPIVGGTAKITGNTDANGSPSNLYARSILTDVNYPLQTGAEIGFTLAITPTVFPHSLCRISGNSSDIDYCQIFSSDGSAYEVSYNSNTSYIELNRTHSHPVCGASCTHDDEHAAISGWKALSLEGNALKAGDITISNNSGTFCLPAGSYYLEKDLDLGYSHIEFEAGAAVNLCLNGKTLKSDNGYYAIYLDQDNVSFTLTDCGTGGKIISSNGNTISINKETDAVAIYGGALECTNAQKSAIYFSCGTLTVAGGTITAAADYAVLSGVSSNLTFNLYGSPTITGQKAGVVMMNPDTCFNVPKALEFSELSVSLNFYDHNWNNPQVLAQGDGVQPEDAARFTFVPYSPTFASATVKYDSGKLILEQASAHSHPVCGASCTHDGEHPDITDWKELSLEGEKLKAGDAYIEADGYYLLPTGCYYLKENMTLNNTILFETDAEVILCLNGKTLTFNNNKRFSLDTNRSSFTLTDCGGSGKVACESTDVIHLANQDSEVTIYGGALENTSNNRAAIWHDSGALTVAGGTITSKNYTYAIKQSYKTGPLNLYGSPVISGTSAGICLETLPFVIPEPLGDDFQVSVTASDSTIELARGAGIVPEDAGKFTFVPESGGLDATVEYDSNGPRLILHRETPAHTHVWDADWSSDATHHWHNCTANGCTITANSEKDGYGVHVFDDAQDETCNTCGYRRSVTPPTPSHTHVWDADWSSNATHHWHNCTASGCTVTSSSQKDGYGVHVYDDAQDETCNTCGYRRSVTPPTPSHTHVWDADWSSDATHHWHNCTASGCTVTSSSQKDGYGVHVYDDAQDETCNTCGYRRSVTPPTPSHTHVWDADWSSDATHHWHDCTAEGCTITVSGEKDGYGTHVYDNGRDKTCDICGYRRETGIYGISGTVTDNDGTAVSGAAVRLMHGNTQISQTSTDAQGNYSFSGVEPGLYNVVAEQNSVTKTILVTITDQNAANQNIKMPDGSKNSVVEVKGQTPPVVVGGVDAIAEAETVSSGDTVTVKLTVEQKDTPSDKADIDAAAQGKMIGLYLDLSLVKTVKPASGSSTDTTISDTQGKVLEVVVPYDLTGKQGITVYRKHGAEAASALTESNTGKDGTFHLDKVNGLIHIFADKFSTYAVAYTPAGQTYTLTVNGGTGSGSYPEGTIVKISAAVPSGQRFTGWTGAATANASMADTTLTMPAQDITVTARFQNISSSSGGGYTPTTAPIEISYTNGGKVSVSHKNAASHTTITLTLTPDQGYEISSVTVTDKNGKDIAVSNKGAGKYSFIMPNGKAAIHAVFTEIAVSHEDCPKNSACPIWPYTDASVDAWYHDGVHYCIENGLMDGYNSHLFGPNDNLSRAQFVQILFNHKGRPVANYLIQFDDVPGDAWYAEAVRWASAQRIISGYSSGSFGPDDNLTREQLAVILWRYAGSPSAAKEELYFSDTNQISSYALDALRWAVENDIISGSGSGQLEPKGVATRAQAAQMLSKFMN